ncbi:hypothetical protein [Longispora albida]|uniref:hypothetical protein n=1 Tax=Longispora albida TaxID=203523 RepID=UPI00037167FB|nr:hypothetical protein [Longispora albida]
MGDTTGEPESFPVPGRTPGAEEPVRHELDRLAARPDPNVVDGELAGTVAELTAEDLSQADRRKLLRRLAAQTGRTWRNVWRPKKAVEWITDTVSDVAPHIKIRDLATLRRHYPGLDGDALAERLVRNAGRVTMAIGAAGGGIATVEWVAPPTLLSTPVLLTAETLAVVAVELKLIGELHEVYGQPVPGNGKQRAVALLQAWAAQRGVTLMTGTRAMAVVLGTNARKQLTQQIAKRFGRSLTTLGPLLSGAAVGGFLNRKATRSLGGEVRKDLRRRAIGY